MVEPQTYDTDHQRDFGSAQDTISIQAPFCKGMSELPSAAYEREQFKTHGSASTKPLTIHLSHGLALTTGSALGSTPPSVDACLQAFVLPNKAGLTVGARAWAKHAHRSGGTSGTNLEGNQGPNDFGWWGRASGPVPKINQQALELFWKVMNSATWRNLHWLPHHILVYEIRVLEGYGMRWFQDQSSLIGSDGELVPGKEREIDGCPWTFRGFVEPMMENGHDVGWRH